MEKHISITIHNALDFVAIKDLNLFLSNIKSGIGKATKKKHKKVLQNE